MKALARKRGKVGRPKKQDVAREPNGRPQRVDGVTVLSNLELEAATWKRRRENPSLTPDEARKQEHGSVIARWLLQSQQARKRNPDAAHQNAFTQAHYDTAVRFDQLRRDWLACIEAKRMRSSSEFGGVGGHPGDPFIVEIAKRDLVVERDFKLARRKILEAGPLCMMAIETIVVENQEAETMRGDLRQALNALGILWRLQAAA